MPLPMSWIWRGSEFQPGGHLPPTDRGFRYGMSVFETVLLGTRGPVFLGAHLEKLRESCARCGFEAALPSQPAIEALLEAIALTGVARLYVTAGDGPVNAPAGNCRIVLLVEPRAGVSAADYERGYGLAIAPEPHLPLLGGIKTGNYWANLLALQNATRRSQQEALLFNTDGELISACMGNVFVVKNRKLFTPPAGSGARAGVVREWVLQRRRADERPLSQPDVREADEVFVTNSWVGIMPAASIDDRPLPSRSVALALLAEYQAALSA